MQDMHGQFLQLHVKPEPQDLHACMGGSTRVLLDTTEGVQ